MRVLLTRAEEDAARTRARLEALGHEVVTAPVIRVVPLAAAWPSGALDAVAATSAHAFAGWGDDGGPSLEARRLLPLLLVGTRTAAAARACGFRGEAVTAGSAGELAALLASHARDLRYAVYLAGRDRKREVERSLGERCRLTIVETYVAQAVGALAPEVGRVLRPGDGVLHYSRRSADLFLAAAESSDVAVTPFNHFALSEDVAAPLREAGCTHVAVASAPDESSLLALLADASPGGPGQA